MQEIILTTGLTKRYKNFHAVDNVTLGVKKGEIYGFLGLNGAGKTTTIRLLLGMIRPTTGSCYINGKKVSSTGFKNWDKVGYMVEAPHSYPDLTVTENLEITRQLRQIRDRGAVRQIIEQLKLSSYANKKAKHLSLGNSQRLGIAKALLHQPEILILDEPANGLDPAGIVEIRELLKDLAFNKGTTIFISSHILNEISKIASKIGIIHNGKFMQEMTANELEARLTKRLVVNTKNNALASTILKTSHFNTFTTSVGTLQLCDQDAISRPEKIAELLVCNGVPPTMLIVEEEDLESYFLRIIGGKEALQQ